MFDADAFLNQETDQQGSTEYIPLPDREWPAQIVDVKYREAKDSHILDIFWEVSSPEVKEITGREKYRIKQGVFLDLTPNGGLDMSKGMNVQLNKVRDAVGQNNPGQPWSPARLKGTAAKISTSSRTDEKTKVTYNDVKAVTRL